jgi:murein DD-endopeptidase MepM/ murein hydrolase activator NlpD
MVTAAALIVALAAAPAIAVSTAARAVQPGELVVLTVTTATDQAVHARAFDHDLAAYRIGPSKWRVLVAIDLDVAPGTYPVAIDAGADAVTRDLTVLPKTFRTRRLKVDPDFVTPPASAAARIEAEAKLLEGIWRSSPAQPSWTGPFVRPVTQPANSAFGTRSVFNGEPRNAHSGADFLSPAGTRVRAPNAGRVVVARPLYFSGNTVVIDHGVGVFSMLAHLSAFDVHEGDQVAARQVVGRVGATGRVTGPHLHWSLRINDSRVDPLSLLALLGKP